MRTETRSELHEAIMQAAWTILTEAAKKRQTIKVTNFESDVQTLSGVTITWERSHEARWNCNRRSIKEKKCVIEAILVTEDGTPDTRAFQLAWESKVYTLPEEETGLNFDKVAVTKKLQNQVFEAFANENDHD